MNLLKSSKRGWRKKGREDISWTQGHIFIQQQQEEKQATKTIYCTFAMCSVSFNVMDKESAQKNIEVRVCDLFKELRGINVV